MEDDEGAVGAAAWRLSRELRELSLGCSPEIDRVHGPLSPLQFVRDFVMPGRPCIISNAIDHWPALHRWSNEYLCSVLEHQVVSVHFTPDGYGDAVVDVKRVSSLYDCAVSCDGYSERKGCWERGEGVSDREESWVWEDGQGVDGDRLLEEGTVRECVVEKGITDACRIASLLQDNKKWSNDERELWFATSHVERMPFPMALDFIVGSRSEEFGVAYGQQQNGCFLSEYSLLASDVEVHIPWATEAFGYMPEAVNLWIGNQKAVTSFHKDHYENLYAVVAGEKHFTLLPPTDVHRLYVKKYRSAHYQLAMDTGKFTIELDLPSRTIPWVSVDPNPLPADMLQARAEFPRYFEGPKPFVCTVKPGELLYLPSMWFHHVRQSPSSNGCTIALNFWYDMQFDIKYSYFNFLQSVLCEDS